MSDAASKPRRSVERASQVLDRAARMSSFKPGFLDRRLFDTQMRTPGKVDAPFSMNSLDPNLLKARGEQMIPIAKVRSEQPTVSLAAAKAKLTSPTGSSKLPQMVQHNGTYWVADGNHRVTAARALGETHIRAQVADLNAQIKGPLIKPGTAAKGIGMAANIAGPVAVAANATMAFKAAQNAGKSDAAAALDATFAGTRTAATGIAIGGTVKALAQAGVKGAALLGRAAVPLSIAGHAAAYGIAAARRGEDGLGVLRSIGWGAINGAVPIDLTTQAITSMRSPKPQANAAPAGGDSRMSAAQSKQFAEANSAFMTGQSHKIGQAEPDSGNTKRGTQNQANLEAINKGRAARAAANQT